jgi:hypothetical protein
MLHTQERQETGERFWQKNLKKLDHLEDLDMDGRI